MNRAKQAGIWLLRCLALCLTGLMLAAGWLLFENGKVSEQAEFIFVGTQDDADCAILLSKGYCVVIDTGEEQDGEHIVQTLTDYGVEKIDCLILSHPDKDHVGGASLLIESFPVTQVLTPYYDYSDGDKEPYQLFLEQAQVQGVPVVTMSRDKQYVFGELKLRVYVPEKFHYDQSNDVSLAVLAQHADVKVFYAGDAEKERLKELLRYGIGEVDLYKTAHHGRESGKGVKLIRLLHPQYAVVTAEEPEEEIAEAYRETGTQVFCTVTQDVRFVSDGSTIQPE